MKTNLKHGDFTGLAADYTNNRPDYAPAIVRSALALVGKPVSDIDFVDVGAGTGIWTRMIAEEGVKSARAVEPNDDMRGEGQAFPTNGNIQWFNGSGENTTLPDNSADMLTMASSFHWVDFEKGTKEFARILRPNGIFMALWNPRYIQSNPLLVEIENHLQVLKGGDQIKRVSSGNSAFTDALFENLNKSPYFSDVIYMESRHTIPFTKERYIGAWRSVNDLRVQLGPDKFQQFLDWLDQKIGNNDTIDAEYLTRAWVARKAG